MPDYRLYCRDETGRFTKAHEFSASGDREALDLARDMNLAVKCELWNRDRMVATLAQRADLKKSGSLSLGRVASCHWPSDAASV